MGASASVQREGNARANPRKAVTAESLRERLHDDYYDGEPLDRPEEEPAGIGMAEVPALLKAKSAFMKNIKTGSKGAGNATNIIKKQDNHGLLKEMFNRIDPSAVSESYSKFLGEIEISIKYKSNESTLLVKIGRAKGLQLPDVHKLPDQFVKVCLIVKRLGDDAAQVQKTRPKSNTVNPLFQEILTFDLIQADLVDAKLVIDVWNKDIISMDDFLGEVILELYKEEVNGGVPSWHKLKPKIDLDIKGRIEVSIDYDEKMLMVTIHQAADLKIADKLSSSSNSYVRSYVTGVQKREETEVSTQNLNPVFEQTFEFEIAPEDLPMRVLVLNVFNKETSGKDTRLGDVHVPLNDIDFQNSERCWYDLADLRNTPHSRNKWSEEGLSQEFKEAMRAHAIYQYPNCLFKTKHNGRKLIAVKCSKGSSSAKMMIVNGIPLDK